MPEVTYSLDRAGLRVIDVLLVEDDPGDVLMTTEAFETSPLRSTLHVVSDGEQALRFLRRTGEFTGAPRPGLILLDLNLPRRELRQERFCGPIVLLGPSLSPKHEPGLLRAIVWLGGPLSLTQRSCPQPTAVRAHRLHHRICGPGPRAEPCGSAAFGRGSAA